MKNSVQLITYVDRLSGGGFPELIKLLEKTMNGLFGGVHLLPFFDSIDGEDAGFDPKNHLCVDKKIGDWGDIKKLTKNYDVMADMIVNHMSSDSEQFKDYLKKGNDSKYASLFLSFSDVFEQGATEEDLLSLYRPRPGMPFTRVKFDDGNSKLLWTTFTPKQIDINVYSDQGIEYLDSILNKFKESGIKLIRLDATGYAVKMAKTSCFMTEHTFSFIDGFMEKAHNLGMKVLVEIHSHYKTQIEIAKRVDLVYDFALPPLVLYSIYSGNCEGLKSWLRESPKNCITVLDTHDGIGIIDIAPDSNNLGILNKEEIDFLVDEIHLRSDGDSLQATGVAANNLDLYQINCTFYEALGCNDNDYLLSRLIQFFCPGIPQVYYVGLLAGKNDMSLLRSTGVGRDINRRFYTPIEVMSDLQRLVVQNLFALIRFRNAHPAFDGEFELLDSDDGQLHISWSNKKYKLILLVDMVKKTFIVKSLADGVNRMFSDWSHFYLKDIFDDECSGFSLFR